MTDLPRFSPVVDPRPDDRPWPPMTWPPPAGTSPAAGPVRLEPAWDAGADDVEALFAALDDDRVWAHVAGRPADPPTLAATLAHAPSSGRWPWLVRLTATEGGLPAGAVVGTTSFLDVSPGDARCEIGWTAYTPAVWATSVNPACKLALMALAFDVLHAGRVQLKTDVRNARSQAAIARLGATFEGVLRRHQRRSDGTVRDSVLFSVVAEQWPEVRDRLQARVTGARAASG